MGGGIHTFLATKSWHTGGQRSRAAVESAEARERERQAAAKRRAAEVEKDRQRLEEARARRRRGGREARDGLHVRASAGPANRRQGKGRRQGRAAL